MIGVSNRPLGPYTVDPASRPIGYMSKRSPGSKDFTCTFPDLSSGQRRCTPPYSGGTAPAFNRFPLFGH